MKRKTWTFFLSGRGAKEVQHVEGEGTSVEVPRVGTPEWSREARRSIWVEGWLGNDGIILSENRGGGVRIRQAKRDRGKVPRPGGLMWQRSVESNWMILCWSWRVRHYQVSFYSADSLLTLSRPPYKTGTMVKFDCLTKLLLRKCSRQDSRLTSVAIVSVDSVACHSLFVWSLIGRMRDWPYSNGLLMAALV